jgi:S1-C subfamily serine protease
LNNLHSLSRAAGERETGTACQVCQAKVCRGEEIVLCRACGSVHHQPCWEEAGGCGSYACSPGRRDPSTSSTAVLRITAEELERVVPLPTIRTVAPSLPPPERNRPRTSRLALASFICAILGIPFFGVLTGLVAILLGSLAVGSFRDRHLKGKALAAFGIILGLGDVVGWLVFLSVMFSRQGPHIEHFRPDQTALDNLPAPINRAMRANVLIETHDGFLDKATSLGSGIIMKRTAGELLILTNRHVVDSDFASNQQAPIEGRADKIVLDVTLVDESVRPGRVTWLAPGGIDLALVQVKGPTPAIRPARWVMGRKARVGDPVFAIGNPHGLGWTHTQGAISQFRLQETGSRQLRIIQTQTALNPGNSGGGLYDQEGYLLGVNTWTKDKAVAEGLNFAISLDALTVLAPPGLDLQAGSEEPDQP